MMYVGEKGLCCVSEENGYDVCWGKGVMLCVREKGIYYV